MFEDSPTFFSQLELSLYRVVFTILEQTLTTLLVFTLILLLVTVLLALKEHLRRLREASVKQLNATLAPQPERKKFPLPLALLLLR